MTTAPDVGPTSARRQSIASATRPPYMTRVDVPVVTIAVGVVSAG
jgi:hypothetical protein